MTSMTIDSNPPIIAIHQAITAIEAELQERSYVKQSSVLLDGLQEALKTGLGTMQADMHMKNVQQIVVRGFGFIPNENGNKKQKTASTIDPELPPILEKEWQLLCFSNPEENWNADLFNRAQSRALRELIFGPQNYLEKIKHLPLVFSYLDLRDLAAVDNCSLKLRFCVSASSAETTHNPQNFRIWQAVARTFPVPAFLWPSNGNKIFRKDVHKVYRVLKEVNRTFQNMCSDPSPSRNAILKHLKLMEPRKTRGGVAADPLAFPTHTQDARTLFRKHTERLIKTLRENDPQRWNKSTFHELISDELHEEDVISTLVSPQKLELMYLCEEYGTDKTLAYLCRSLPRDPQQRIQILTNAVNWGAPPESIDPLIYLFNDRRKYTIPHDKLFPMISTLVKRGVRPSNETASAINDQKIPQQTKAMLNKIIFGTTTPQAK